MKKLLSFALVLLTALSFCVPVCAADNGGVLIATDFKDRKAHFVPLDLNLASANIVTVDGNECLYIATRNTGANNWLGFPVPQTLEKETDYVFAFDVAVPQLSDGTKTGSVKMYWNVITGAGADKFTSGDTPRADIGRVDVPVGTWKHVELTFRHGLDFTAFGFSDWTEGDNKNVNAEYYIDNLVVCKGSEYQEIKNNFKERSGKANAPDGYLSCDFSGVGVINRPDGDKNDIAGGYRSYNVKDYDGNGCVQIKRKSADDELGWTDNRELTLPFSPAKGKTYNVNFRLRYVGSDAAPSTKLDFYLTNGTGKQDIKTVELKSKEWTDVKFTVTADGDYTALAMLEQKINDLNGFFQFDNLTITEKGSSAATADFGSAVLAFAGIAAAGIYLSLKNRKKSV